MSHHKKFYFILLMLIAGSVFLLISQIKQAMGIVTTYTETPIVSPIAAYIPIDPTDPTLGNPGASMWIVLFADLGCKKCHEASYAITNFVNNHPDEARLIWKDAPQTSLFSTGNIPAHLSAYCSYEQGQFWKFANLVMQDKNNLKENGLIKIAQGLKMDMAKWNACRASIAAQNKIIGSMALAKSLGVTELPGIFVNNRKINLTPDINIGELLAAYAAKTE